MSTALLAIGLTAAAVVAARAGLFIVTVKGDSMSPVYPHGDRLLVVRRVLAPPRRGAVVVACLSEALVPGRRVVKRLAARAGEVGPDGTVVPPGRVFLLGEADDSTDSRTFGPVPADAVVGVVVRRLRPAAGRGRPAS
ncbi:S24/S26 family peptidase [Virgisporangium aurantiacum]|uniref:Signal peptidase I n=1 Tax=Virgisporangium aurantiacum TaxID=175570 RepID=A0A8J4E764_9ACTN|nr:S24/S26 family peptidase [Virgisporangium aurantiacum]GIJ64196.1 hypothetical protein Vau01_117120 [Virgisporangium aurantiacum]